MRTFKADLIGATNSVLSNAGLAPVSSLSNENPMVAMATNLLLETSRNIQVEGFAFNTEHHYPLTPDVNGEIVVPDNVLSLDIYDLQTLKEDPVLRGNRLYDRYNHTFVFTHPLEGDVVWCFDFVDCPEAFKSYVTIRAANLFAGRAVGSVEAVKFGEREELLARAAFLNYDAQQGDYNFLGDRTGRRLVESFRPYSVIMRR